MTFEQLEEWAKAQGKTTDDMVRWLAFADAVAYQEMTTLDFVEELMNGIPKYDREYFWEHWEGLDDEARTDYPRYMLEAWANPESQI